MLLTVVSETWSANSERQQYITRGQHDTRPGVEQSLQ